MDPSVRVICVWSQGREDATGDPRLDYGTSEVTKPLGARAWPCLTLMAVTDP